MCGDPHPRARGCRRRKPPRMCHHWQQQGVLGGCASLWDARCAQRAQGSAASPGEGVIAPVPSLPVAGRGVGSHSREQPSWDPGAVESDRSLPSAPPHLRLRGPRRLPSSQPQRPTPQTSPLQSRAGGRHGPGRGDLGWSLSSAPTTVLGPRPLRTALRGRDEVKEAPRPPPPSGRLDVTGRLEKLCLPDKRAVKTAGLSARPGGAGPPWGGVGGPP